MIFKLTEDQALQAHNWIMSQLHVKPADSGAAGGRFSFVFTPNGLGEGVEVVDQITGDKLNITDYSDW